MRHFFLYTSNRLEHLALVLAKVTAAPLDPLLPETILVQSAGMQRWVSMQMAQEHGIWANARFPFPVAFAHELACALLPDLPAEYALSQERMLWRVASLLPQMADRPEFAPVKRYLDGADTLKLIQLSQKIAFHFDQYLIFRPHWAARWESGQLCGDLGENSNMEAWQAALWREVVRGREQEHRAALLQRVMAAVEQNSAALPPRLSIFGVSSLPPAYLDLLLTLAEHIPVHMFLLNPSNQYWGDLADKKKRRQEYRQLAQRGSMAEEKPAMPLLELGTLGRDFHEMLVNSGVEEISLFRKNENPQTLLEQVQKDLLDLTLGTGDSPDHTNESDNSGSDKPLLNFDDASIQIHCCHSPMREMEILQDLILDHLQQDESLSPRDILIMTPDMDLYAPFIQAVFGAPEDPAKALPFALADRRPSQALRHARLFLDLMEFGQRRFEAPAVLELLEAPGIRQKLMLTEDEAARMEHWVSQARIRWGVDPAFQARTGNALYSQNTWEHGLARLFLGYMTGPKSAPFQGISPLGPISGSDQELLGRLAAFLDQLAEMWKFLNVPTAAQEWQERMLWMLDTFFPQDRDTADALCDLRQSVTALTQAMAADAPQLASIDGRTMQHLLRGRLDAAPAEGGFLSSGLTFCGLRPMRAIPFRLICLAGLSTTSFPRQDIRPSFDLMSVAPRPGDRSLRDDDRYLFLESLISAQDALILTYPGLSPKDNSEAPPSVLVSELLDYLDSRAKVKGKKPSEILVTKHRLQGFHPDYFRGELFSYSAQNCAGAKALCGQPVEHTFFTSSPLSTEDAQIEELSLAELESFLAHPIRCLLRSLGVEPSIAAQEIPDEEPLAAPDGLEKYALSQDLLQLVLSENPPEAALEKLLRTSQALPPGPAGQDIVRSMQTQLREQAVRIRTEQAGREPFFNDLTLDLGRWQVTARLVILSGEEGEHLLTFRPATLKGSDMLSLWVRHLAATAAGRPVTSAHVGTDEVFRLPLMDQKQAKNILRNLVTLRQAGMTAPLPFFPRASLAYAKKRFDPKGSDPDKALEEAIKVWMGGYKRDPERDDPFLCAAYRDTKPDWGEFATTAEAIYGPLFGGDHAG